MFISGNDKRGYVGIYDKNLDPEVKIFLTI